MGELGLLGIPWSEELGGAGLDTIAFMIAIEELARVDASHSITISAHTTLGTSPIVNFGTPEQKQRFVPLLAAGKVLGGFGLTEDGGRQRRRRHATTRREEERPLRAQRLQALHHARRRRRGLRRHRRDRPREGHAGHLVSFILTKDSCDLERVQGRSASGTTPSSSMTGFRSGKKEDKLGWRASDTRELHLRGRRGPGREPAGRGGERASSTS